MDTQVLTNSGTGTKMSLVLLTEKTGFLVYVSSFSLVKWLETLHTHVEKSVAEARQFYTVTTCFVIRVWCCV